MREHTRPRFTTFLMILFMIVLFPACNKKDETRPLVALSYGGAWQDVQREVMFRPYESSFGVTIKDIEYDGQYEWIKTMVEFDSVFLDVVDTGGNILMLGTEDGVLEPMDYSVIDKQQILPDAIHPYGVGICYWSWVMAYNTDVFHGDAVPKRWKDFFDLERFPGPRGLKIDPRRTLEIALLADGVSSKDLYPLDVDRAFRVLDNFLQELRSTGTPLIWWKEYAIPTRLLADKAVVLTPATNGRIWLAREKKGWAVDFSWEQGILDLDWWTIPKGAYHKNRALRFIAFASSHEVQSQIPLKIPYGPVNIFSDAQVPEAIRKDLPTAEENRKRQIPFDIEWWSKNYNTIQTRWSKWFSRVL